MKFVAGMSAALILATGAQADFSYTVTRKTSGPIAGGPQTSTYYYKGQKIKVDNGSTATIVDFDAQTITVLNNAAKSYTVKSIGEGASSPESNGIEAKIDVKDTGQKKTVNGFKASETLMTAEIESTQAPRPMKMKIEMELWASPDVPGAGELHDFHRRNAARFPWQAVAGGGDPAMQKAMTDIQKKMALMNGVLVQEIVRVTPADGGAAMPAMPQMSGAQSAPMVQARAKLEAMVAQGGPAAAYAKQALDRMPGGAPAGGTSSPASGALMEITMDSGGFSSASIPDSTFAIPAGYAKGN